MSDNTDGESGLATRIRDETKEPDDFHVILHNDNVTTMEFVVSILMSVFHKTLSQATMLMLDVHSKGKAIIGTYSYDIATTKVSQVHTIARQNGFPLRCTTEKA